jgi:hypothetical protein
LGPKDIALREVGLIAPQPADVVVKVRFSGISTGTEKLFWSGTMPPFPGMGYPLVPGYEAAGEVVEAGCALAIPSLCLVRIAISQTILALCAAYLAQHRSIWSQRARAQRGWMQAGAHKARCWRWQPRRAMPLQAFKTICPI